MNIFRCSNCGFQVQRPTQPFSCPQCGRQAIGLFRVVGQGGPGQGAPVQGSPTQGGWPQQPGMPQQGIPQQPGMQPGMPQQMPQQGWPQQPGMPQQHGMLQQPGIPMNPQAPWQPQGGQWPQQPGQPMPQQPMMPQQGPWPGQSAQSPGMPGQAPAGNLWGQQAPMQPAPQTGWPGQPSFPQQHGIPQQPGMPQQHNPQQGIPQQGAWPGATPQQPAPTWGAQPGMPQQNMPHQGYPQPGMPQQSGMPQPPGGQQRPGITPPPQGFQTAPQAFPRQPTQQPSVPAQQHGQPSSVQQPTAAPGSNRTPFGGPQPQRKTPPAQPGSPAAPSRPTIPQPPQQPPAAPRQSAVPGATGQPPAARRPESDVGVDGKSPTQSKPREPAPPPVENKTPPPEETPQSKRPHESAESRRPAETRKPTETISRPSPQPEVRPRSSEPTRNAAREPSIREPAQRETSRPARPIAAPKPITKIRPPRPERFVCAFPTEPVPDEKATALRNAPAVTAEGLILLHYSDRLVAMRLEDKQPKVVWEYVTGCRAPGPVVLGPQDTVRLHCTDGYLHCLDAGSGKQVWSPAPVGEPLGYAVPVIDADGNTYISSVEGGLHRIDSMGRLQKPPFFRSRQKLDSPGLIFGSTVYIGSEQGYLCAIDISAEKGRNVWNQAAEQGYVGVVRAAPVLAGNGCIIAAAQDDALYGISPSGVLAWKTAMPGQLLGGPVFDSHGHIYLGISQSPRNMDPRGLLVCIDGNSHKIRWEYRAAGPVESTPVIGDDDVIYFGDNAGVVHAVDLMGHASWTADLGSPVRSAGTIVAPQRVAFGLDEESLVVLECSSAGIAAEGWPKVGRTLGQNGLIG